MAIQEIAHVTGPDTGESQEALRAAVLGSHDLMSEMLEAAATPRACGTEPRRARQLADTFLVTACRHLAAVDDALLPVVRRRLEGGRQMVTAYVLHTRQVERTLRSVKACLYGDANASKLKCSDLWQRLRRLLAEHDVQERAIVEQLTETLSEREMNHLAAKFQRIEQRSPTRPHPFSPHAGFAGRVSKRVWSVVDGFFDQAEGRVIPYQAPRPHPSSDSLLTGYVLGTPRFADPRRSEPRAS
jgi:hypothetical protein